MNSDTAAWVITGPTSGIGYQTALELASHGTVVLVGRNLTKIAAVRREIEASGGAATEVVADLSDVTSARRAAAEIAALDLPIRGVLNNAGTMLSEPALNAQGWELTFATNHLGPLAFTDALIPSLADGTNIVFITSGAEDPDLRAARIVGFRGSRYISAQAASRGEHRSGGASRAGADAYATSKQGNLAATFALAREFSRLRFRAIQPGVNITSSLGDNPAAVRVIGRLLGPVLTLLPHFTSPVRVAKVITRILTDTSGATGVYFDEQGRLMTGSDQVTDPAYADRYIAESRELLASVPT